MYLMTTLSIEPVTAGPELYRGFALNVIEPPIPGVALTMLKPPFPTQRSGFVVEALMVAELYDFDQISPIALTL